MELLILNLSSMQLEIVPFGKYKNQPVEVLKNDKQYLDWLNAQDWFKSRYQNIYNLVINNNYGQPAETPEHNKLVSLFLNDDFCEKFANLFIEYPKYFINYLQNESYNLKSEYSYEYQITQNPQNSSLLSDYWINRVLIFEKKMLELKNIVNEKSYKLEFKKQFEDKKGNDLELFVYIYVNNISVNHYCLNIECKPTVSEDYPAIIRQCKNQNSNVLLIENYNVQSITIEQMRKMFPFIKIILLSEIL